MNDPQEPGRFPGDDDPEQPPLIPPPRAAADDRPPPARPHGVPSPRGSDAPHSGSGVGAGREPDGGPHGEPTSGTRHGRGREGERADHERRERPQEWATGATKESAHPPLEAPYDMPPEARRGLPHEVSRGLSAERSGRDPDGRHTWSDAVPEQPPEPLGGIPHPTGEAVPSSPVPWSTQEPPSGGPQAPLDHGVLKSLLGAWALSACSPEETHAVEAHLTDCAPCAGEALRLRDAVALLHPEDSLDLNPRLRGRVLEGALGRRPPRIPIPTWAAPFDAEAARLDALLRDMAKAEWQAPVRLRWFAGDEMRARTVTVAEVIGHLTAVDGLVATSLRMPDPLTTAGVTGEDGQPPTPHPLDRTEAYWRSAAAPHGHTVRGPWREQTHALVRGAGLVEPALAEHTVPGIGLPLRDAFVDRAFECWVHACDIAEAVDYPHPPPEGGHLYQLVELAARTLPFVLASRRQTGLAAPPRRFAVAGAPGRTLHLEVEGSGGGDWFIPLDSPAASGSAEGAVAHVALDGLEFCQLVAGHVSPLDAAAGAEGDPEAIRDVLFATASMSRL